MEIFSVNLNQADVSLGLRPLPRAQVLPEAEIWPKRTPGGGPWLRQLWGVGELKVALTWPGF